MTPKLWVISPSWNFQPKVTGEKELVGRVQPRVRTTSNDAATVFTPLAGLTENSAYFSRCNKVMGRMNWSPTGAKPRVGWIR